MSTNGDDNLLGDSRNNIIGGGDGNDRIAGLDGDDRLFGDNGNDSLSGGIGNDTLGGGSDGDGKDGDDSDGDDSDGDDKDGDDKDGDDKDGDGKDGDGKDDGNDTLEGGPGADRFIDSGGIDELSYASDTKGVTVNLATGEARGGDAEGDKFGGNTFENLRGGSGNDVLTGSTHFDNKIWGGGGNDRITTKFGDSAFGEAGDDVITGSPEAGKGLEDYLDGGAGDDVIASRGGDDKVLGGDGNDTVQVSLGDGKDVLDGGTETGRDILQIQDWTGPTNFGTDDLASGTYGNWTVGGDPGTNAWRTFTHTDGTSFTARDFEGITCFAEGTLIATARGEVPVETLRAGDLVLTAHGTAALKPLIWVGHTTVDVARQRNQAAIAPVVIKAGALADGVPFRDLRVSPDHSIFLDGRLVPAKLLVNGSTIVQETWCRSVTYWHIELEGHGLVVSEGAVTESYFDDGNRHLFDNAGIAAIAIDFAAHRPNGRYADAACAPQLHEGDAALERIRARLAYRVPARRASA